ncbi:MAG: hypothetical protein ABIF10_06945, partial [Candidatus Woesearchaeota archaeon]
LTRIINDMQKNDPVNGNHEIKNFAEALKETAEGHQYLKRKRKIHAGVQKQYSTFIKALDSLKEKAAGPNIDSVLEKAVSVPKVYASDGEQLGPDFSGFSRIVPKKEGNPTYCYPNTQFGERVSGVGRQLFSYATAGANALKPAMQRYASEHTSPKRAAWHSTYKPGIGRRFFQKAAFAMMGISVLLNGSTSIDTKAKEGTQHVKRVEQASLLGDYLTSLPKEIGGAISDAILSQYTGSALAANENPGNKGVLSTDRNPFKPQYHAKANSKTESSTSVKAAEKKPANTNSLVGFLTREAEQKQRGRTVIYAPTITHNDGTSYELRSGATPYNKCGKSSISFPKHLPRPYPKTLEWQGTEFPPVETLEVLINNKSVRKVHRTPEGLSGDKIPFELNPGDSAKFVYRLDVRNDPFTQFALKCLNAKTLEQSIVGYGQCEAPGVPPERPRVPPVVPPGVPPERPRVPPSIPPSLPPEIPACAVEDYKLGDAKTVEIANIAYQEMEPFQSWNGRSSDIVKTGDRYTMGLDKKLRNKTKSRIENLFHPWKSIHEVSDIGAKIEDGKDELSDIIYDLYGKDYVQTLNTQKNKELAEGKDAENIAYNKLFFSGDTRGDNVLKLTGENYHRVRWLAINDTQVPGFQPIQIENYARIGGPDKAVAWRIQLLELHRLQNLDEHKKEGGLRQWLKDHLDINRYSNAFLIVEDLSTPVGMNTIYLYRQGEGVAQQQSAGLADSANLLGVIGSVGAMAGTVGNTPTKSGQSRIPRRAPSRIPCEEGRRIVLGWEQIGGANGGEAAALGQKAPGGKKGGPGHGECGPDGSSPGSK